MSARTERQRGFTLLELIVAAAVGMVIITAAMAAFDLQSQFARNTERLLSTQASAGLGLTMMQRDLENAGLRFRGGVQNGGPGAGPSYAAVVRPYDNLGSVVTTLKNNLLGVSPVVAVAPAAAGFIPGTDAFEVLQGGPLAQAQRIAAQVVTAVPAGNQVTVRINPNPFIANELTAVGSFAPVLMFWNDDVHCMGRVVPPAITAGSPAVATVQTVDADLAPSGNPWPANCPKALMQVEVLQQRHRYLVYQSADNIGPGVNRPGRLGLYMQSNPPCDPVGSGVQVCTTDLDAPVMVAEGVDDLQIAWRVPNPYSATTAGWCQFAPPDVSCGFDQAAWTAPITERAAAIYGAQIMLTSRGQEVYRRPGEAVPPLLNYVPAVPVDGIVRTIMQTSVLFRNSVTP